MNQRWLVHTNSNVTRTILRLFVMAFAVALGSCQVQRPDPMSFKSAFGSVSLPSSGIGAEALDLPGRDFLRYGRLVGGETEIQRILESNGAEMRGDPERAGIDLMGVRGVADTVGGFPGHWLSPTEVARDWGHIGDFQVLLCSVGDDTWVIYLTDRTP